MLRYTFTNGSNSLFQSFSVFRLQVGILMWISTFFELLMVFLQFYHLGHNIARTEEPFVDSMQPLHIPVSIAINACALISILLAIIGVRNIRAPLCLPYLLICFVSSFESLILFVMGVLHYTNTNCAKDLYYGLWFASALPFHLFSTGVAFWFIVFAQQFSYYVAYQKELIDSDCLFQIQRNRTKVV